MQRAKDTATADACRVTLAIFFTALLDKEGMDAEQLQRIWHEVEALSESVRDGYVSGGTRRNLDWVRPHLTAGPGIGEDDLLLLADAQTSGGLLVVGEVPGYPIIGHTTIGAGIEIR